MLDGAGGPDLVERIARQVSRFRLLDVETDVLKVLYESLIDPAQRHDLGEYYTPDWLAAQMSARVIDNPLAQRVLDPACGSGTFLFHAVRRFLAAAEAAGIPSSEAVTRCSAKVLGIDVHPVAVIIARVTYLLALGEERLREHPPVAVPVYLGDALQWNTRTFMAEREVLIEVPDAPRALFFPFIVTRDPGLFDAVVGAMLELSAQDADDTAFGAWLARRGIVHEADTEELAQSYGIIRDLQAHGRDHIWGYVARNLSRPIWLSTDIQRADVLLGNPPWLAYRYMSRSLQGRFRTECRQRGLWSGGDVANVQDLSAYFFARCVELYLRPEGHIAFVMPYAALSRAAYAGFRSGAFGIRGQPPLATVRFEDIWTLDERVQPLFPVPSCVVVARLAPTGPFPRSVTAYAGELPRRDASSSEADQSLSMAAEPWPSRAPTAPSPYRNRFKVGATLFPRLFVFVDEVRSGVLGQNPAVPAVQSRRSHQEKEPWRGMASLRGSIEREFLKPVYQGASVLPYHVREPLLGIIPMDPTSGEVLSAARAREKGFPHLARWMETAESIWGRNGPQGLSLVSQLDYYGKLAAQFPPPAIRVVYPKSGTYAAAAMVRTREASIDETLVWLAVGEAEGRYLEAVLNSETLRVRAAHLQSRGQWGTRDFSKVLLDLPIPRFSPTEQLHSALVAAASHAEQVAARISMASGLDFVRARTLVRQTLAADGVAGRIDALVVALLDGSTGKAGTN